MRISIVTILVIVFIPIMVIADDNYVPGEVVVSFKDKNVEIFTLSGDVVTCTYQGIDSYLQGKGMLNAREIYHGDKGVRNIYVLKFDERIDVLSIASDMKSYSEVNDATPNYYLEFLAEPNDWYYGNDWWVPEWWDFGWPDPYFPDTVRCLDQWNLQLMQADKAWGITTGDQTITIAFLDSGVDYFHPDLMDNIWVNPWEDLDADGVVWDADDMDNEDGADPGDLVDDLLGWDFVDNDNNPFPDTLSAGSYQHGTMMSSVCAVTNNDVSAGDTSIAGITWHCKIVPLRISTQDHLTAAINYSITMGFDVLNMSVGAPGYIAGLYEAVQRADSCGIVQVAAAGKELGMEFYPAAFPEVIGVAAVDEFGNKLSTSGAGDYVDVCALGANISPRRMPIATCGYYYQHCPGSTSPHVYFFTPGHTSYASAQVSALAGLLFSLYPGSAPDFIRGEIERGAVPVDTAQGNIGEWWEGRLGAGRINSYRSLTQWGQVRNDTTWTNFAYISADMRVDEGATLTIEPGTIIHVAPDDNENFGTDPDRIVLEVYGTLNINGTAEQPVEFKSLAGNPQPGDWYGIWYKGVNSSGTVSHCKISDALYGIKSKKTITVRDCEIKNCQISGIYMYRADGTSNSSLISNCDIIDNCVEEASGIQIWNCWDTVTVDSCNVSRNYRGIWLSNTVPNIKNSVIYTNTTDGIWVTYYQCLLTTYPRIEWCRLQGNEESGIYFDYTSGEVSNTKIWDGGYNGIYCNGSESQPEINHTKIFGQKYGVRAGLGALPVLGDVAEEMGMNNAIYGNDEYEVYNAYTTTTIMAENCWWGTDLGEPPAMPQFYNSVDFNPYLESDPVSYLYPRARDRSNEIWLARNYPNPCNSSGTTISYFIPAGKEAVSLVIYDILGRRIKTLANTVQGPGEYRIRWNGRNDKGVVVAPGVYFYKLSVGSKSQTKKLVFFR